MDTPSAPNFIASSTEQTRVLALGYGDRLVDADRCKINPTSIPPPRWPSPTRPLCSTMALAPPFATFCIVCFISSRPSIGPTEMPWSIGTITVLPVFRLMIRSNRIRLPKIVITYLLLCKKGHEAFSSPRPFKTKKP